MKDFLKKYQKRKTAGNVFIVLGALVLALGINFFIIDTTDLGKNMKASVLDIKNTEKKADLTLETHNAKIVLKNTKKIESITNFSVSLSYNPESVSIKNINSSFGEINILGEKSDGIITIILNANGKTIEKNNTIIDIEVNKLKEESTQINMINANFTDSENENFEFTTSGITF